jgi:hypothetical protein
MDEERDLGVEPSAEPRESAVAPDDSVAGHDDREWIRADGLPDGSGAAGFPDRLGHLSVRHDFAFWYLAQGEPNRSLKRSAVLQIHDGTEVRILACRICRQSMAQGIHVRIRAFGHL